jgi:hypothetical protein
MYDRAANKINETKTERRNKDKESFNFMDSSIPPTDDILNQLRPNMFSSSVTEHHATEEYCGGEV